MHGSYHHGSYHGHGGHSFQSGHQHGAGVVGILGGVTYLASTLLYSGATMVRDIVEGALWGDPCHPHHGCGPHSCHEQHHCSTECSPPHYHGCC